MPLSYIGSIFYINLLAVFSMLCYMRYNVYIAFLDLFDLVLST